MKKVEKIDADSDFMKQLAAFLASLRYENSDDIY